MGDSDAAVLREAAEEILRGNALGKSEIHRKLFQYLLDRALQGAPPRELDIAFDVFNKDASFTGSEDALVRVHVRALRVKLDEYYRGPGKASPVHLSIPKGAYRLSATAADPSTVPVDGESSPLPGPSRRWRFVVSAGVLVILAVSLVLNLSHWSSRAPARQAGPAVDATPIWQMFLEGDRPITLVLGDFFLFSRPIDDGIQVRVVDPRIRSSLDLQRFTSAHSGLDASFGKSQTTLLPKSVAVALGNVLPIVERSGRPWSLRLSSELRFEDLRDTDVFYFGPLNRIGLISDFVKAGSSFRYLPDYTLEDTTDGKLYVGSGEDPGMLTDYALFTAVPGPADNRIYVFGNAGKDIGLLRLIDQMTTPAGLGQVLDKLPAERNAVPRYFEILLAVRGYDRTDIGAEIIAARAIPAGD